MLNTVSEGLSVVIVLVLGESATRKHSEGLFATVRTIKGRVWPEVEDFCIYTGKESN